MMCLFGVHFAYLVASAYYYYEQITMEYVINMENLLEIQWALSSSLTFFLLIGVSVAITREVKFDSRVEDCRGIS